MFFLFSFYVSFLMSLILSLYEVRGGFVCQSACGMHYLIWKKAVISPNTVKKAQSPGSTPPPPSQISSASATGNAAGAALTGIPCILLSCAHKKSRGKKGMRHKGKITVRVNPFCVTMCQRVCMWLVFQRRTTSEK